MGFMPILKVRHLQRSDIDCQAFVGQYHRTVKFFLRLGGEGFFVAYGL